MIEQFLIATKLAHRIFENDNIYHFMMDNIIIIQLNKTRIAVEFLTNKFKIFYGEDSLFELYHYHYLAQKMTTVDELECLRKKYFAKFAYLEVTNNYDISLSKKSIINYQNLKMEIDKNKKYPELTIYEKGRQKEIVTLKNFDTKYIEYFEAVTQMLSNVTDINEFNKNEILLYNQLKNELEIKTYDDFQFSPYLEYQEVRIKKKKKIKNHEIKIDMRYIEYDNLPIYPSIIVAYDEENEEIKIPKIILINRIDAIREYLETIFKKFIYKRITVHCFELYEFIKNYFKGLDIIVNFSSDASDIDFLYEDYEYIINKNGL